MAKTLTQIGIETGNTVEAYHVSQSIDAFTGVEAYDISLSGSFNMTGSINGQSGIVNPLTSSFAITASHALNITSSPIQTTGSTLYSTNPSTTNFSTNNSIFLGANTGNNSTNAIYSHFIGQTAGADATNSSYSNFIGQSAGQGATNASQSNFLGEGAGQIATNADNSNFFGNYTGNRALSASYSTLIGFQVGQSGSWGTIGSNNIIIGTNISLPNARNNSINLGGIIFATGSYSERFSDTYTGSQANSRVGIAKDFPNSTLDVAGNTTITGSLIVTGSITGSPTVINNLTASYAVTASHVPNTFVQNGNSFGTTARLGTNDSQPIVFETNNSQRMNISSTGTIGMGSGGQGTLFHLLNATTTTVGNVSADLITLPTSTGVAYTVQAYVVGWGGSDGKIGGEVIGVFSNVGGTLTSAGTPITSSIEDFSGSPTFTLTTSGTNIILRVSGSTATTISWSGHMKYLQHDSNS